MLGLVMGTINRFRQETTEDPAVARRAAIQAKLLERVAEERALLGAQVEQERAAKRLQTEARQAQWAQEDEAGRVEARRVADRQLACFLRTTGGGAPEVYYLPALLTEAQQKLIEGQGAVLEQ